MEIGSTRHYRYDALDILTSSSHPSQPPEQRFYQAGQLTTEVQGPLQRSVLQQGQQLLGVQQRSALGQETALLGTDQQRSILYDDSGSRAYSSYGHASLSAGIASLLGFNGERPDPLTGHYLLGSYRAFNPFTLRFNSPDNLSPFNQGGLNAYAYCTGDPVNRSDPSGHSPIEKIAGLIKRISAEALPSTASKSDDALQGVAQGRVYKTPAWARRAWNRKYTTAKQDLVTAKNAVDNLPDHPKINRLKSKPNFSRLKQNEFEDLFETTWKKYKLGSPSNAPDPNIDYIDEISGEPTALPYHLARDRMRRLKKAEGRVSAAKKRGTEPDTESHILYLCNSRTSGSASLRLNLWHQEYIVRVARRYT